MDFKKYLIKLKSFIKECTRVLKITKKPTTEEYKSIVKVTAIGLVIIGLVGFIITIGAMLIGI